MLNHIMIIRKLHKNRNSTSNSELLPKSKLTITTKSLHTSFGSTGSAKTLYVSNLQSFPTMTKVKSKDDRQNMYFYAKDDAIQDNYSTLSKARKEMRGGKMDIENESAYR